MSHPGFWKRKRGDGEYALTLDGHDLGAGTRDSMAAQWDNAQAFVGVRPIHQDNRAPVAGSVNPGWPVAYDSTRAATYL